MEWLSWVLSGGALLTLVGVAVWKRGSAGLGEGTWKSWDLLCRSGPNLALGFLIAGFLAALLPERFATTWMGGDSGIRGLWVGTLVGAVTPGGPYAHFPILAALAQKGAGVGPIAAYIASWSLLGIHRILIWEVPFLGWRFALVRMGACLVVPPVIGVLARIVAQALWGVSPGAVLRG